MQQQIPQGILASAAEQATPSDPMQQAGDGVDPKLLEAFGVIVARVRQALAKVAPDLDSALKAQPVTAAVNFGVAALRQVVAAAEQAGVQLPPEAVLAAGMQMLKDLAEIALQKGYIREAELQPFLKEGFQQAIARYTQLDAKEGRISQQDMGAIQQSMGSPRGVLAKAASAKG